MGQDIHEEKADWTMKIDVFQPFTNVDIVGQVPKL